MKDAELMAEAAKALQWSLGQIEMCDKRLVQLGDPPELVYSETEKNAMIWATNVMLKLLAKSQQPNS